MPLQNFLVSNELQVLKALSNGLGHGADCIALTAALCTLQDRYVRHSTAGPIVITSMVIQTSCKPTLVLNICIEHSLARNDFIWGKPRDTAQHIQGH